MGELNSQDGGPTGIHPEPHGEAMQAWGPGISVQGLRAGHHLETLQEQEKQQNK